VLVSQPINLRSLVEIFSVRRNRTVEDRRIRVCNKRFADCDRDPIPRKQVFCNLIDDAVRFSRDRHPAKKTEIGVLPQLG